VEIDLLEYLWIAGAANPWLAVIGMLAHPRAPLGGCGPGNSKLPCCLGADGNDANPIAHPQSPVGSCMVPTAEQRALLLGHGGSSPSKAKGKKGQELNLVGSFPQPSSWKWNPAKEKQLVVDKKWYPHTLDFKAVAGSGSKEIASAGDFLLKIIQAKSSISRLNFFSHGVWGIIAMEGSIPQGGGSVSLGTAATEGGWEAIIGTGAIVRPYGDKWGDFGEHSGTAKVPVGTTAFTLDEVRAKFTDDATIWLYLCYGASDPDLFQGIANTFQVTVKGFTSKIVYHVPGNFPKNRKHGVASGTGNPVSDFRTLSAPTTKTPKKPQSKP